MADATSDVFQKQPPHSTDRVTGVTSWLVHPYGVVHRVPAGAFICGDMALYLTSGAKTMLLGRFSKERRFLHVFDLTNAVGYNTHARQLLTNWALNERDQIDQVVIVTPPALPVLRMGVSTMMVAARTAAIKMDMVDDFAEAVRRLSLRPA